MSMPMADNACCSWGLSGLDRNASASAPGPARRGAPRGRARVTGQGDWTRGAPWPPERMWLPSDNHAEATVSSPRGRVRSRRKALTVAVAGAASPVGEQVVRAFTAPPPDGQAPAFGKVVALDAERGAADAHWRLVDLVSPALAKALRGVD